MLEQELKDTTQGPGGSLEGQGQHRANTTMHVCWYRNTSVSRADHSAAVEVWLCRSPTHLEATHPWVPLPPTCHPLDVNQFVKSLYWEGYFNPQTCTCVL